MGACGQRAATVARCVCGGNGRRGELFVWDAVGDDSVASCGTRILALEADMSPVFSLAWSLDGAMLVSGGTGASSGEDGVIKLWDLHSRRHLVTLRRDRPYERLNITGIRGVTEAQKTTLRALGAIEDAAVNNTQQAL